VSEPRTLPELLRRNSYVCGPKPVLVEVDRVITHRQLDDESRDLAGRLVASGVIPASRVGLVMPNGVDWAIVAAAVMRIGATLVPLSTFLRPPELKDQLSIAAATELIVIPEYRTRSYLDDLEMAAPGLLETTSAGSRSPLLPSLRQVWTADALPTNHVAGEMVGSREDAVRPTDDLVVIFTSGSRGAPKGTIHTHGSALRATSASLACRCLGTDDRLYIPMPFFWTGGFATGLMSVLVAGATLITEAAADPEQTIHLLEREKVTLFRGWPDQAARIAAHPRFASADLSHLRGGSLAAVLPPSQRPATGARANLLGMTETFGPYCGARLDVDLPKSKHGSCGRPFDGVEVRVVDAETGSPVEPGQPGEIALRGPNLMRGICGRSRRETFSGDAFYRTGDLGTLDPDGYLWFHGRLDDMFKVKGATVYPAEVESALRQIDDVQEAFVTNVPVDGHDVVGALVVSTADAGHIESAVAGRLSAFKVPRLWFVSGHTGTVPMSATGKVDKAALQQLLLQQGQPVRKGSQS
jgi:acyl-CoA synthetase (AMP-forming)/AMP-acid ligase II